jgi:hypothetical protein
VGFLPCAVSLQIHACLPQCLLLFSRCSHAGTNSKNHFEQQYCGELFKAALGGTKYTADECAGRASTIQAVCCTRSTPQYGSCDVCSPGELLKNEYVVLVLEMDFNIVATCQGSLYSVHRILTSQSQAA